MKNAELQKRLRKDRPMISIYQALMLAYIGQGLRQDLARLEDRLWKNSWKA
ncbi:hypothetical protein U14_00699 [Candidatus Moduliflexus flocculans]|uniref:Uncharacterized protein n=1 Tax=Candidatus Moduliflexus flocculans TaxID=1499966 RepID=A0A0S6VQL7_9BACT|nr:hypothetical protein U14_00699 [Candidatus Moduliflexus flocculans]